MLSLGATSQLVNDLIACPGEAFTLTCTIRSVLHIWKVGANNEKAIGTGSLLVQMEAGITYLRVAIQSTRIVTNITGTVVADMNNTHILCRNGFIAAEIGEPQRISARVYGKSKERTGRAIHFD